MWSSLAVPQGCRSDVKPAWLNLCFLSPLYGLRQGFSSPEVMMASFLAEIWKEQEILWLSFERWLYYWDATNKGWCLPGIPRLALSASLLSLFPLKSLFPTLPLYSFRRERLQYLGLIRKHIHQRRHKKINRSLSVCLKVTDCYLRLWFHPPWQLFCINHNTHTADCSLPKPVMKLPATLWHSCLPRPHTVLIPTQFISLLPTSSCSAKNDIWKIKLFDGGRLCPRLISSWYKRWCWISVASQCLYTLSICIRELTASQQSPNSAIKKAFPPRSFLLHI